MTALDTARALLDLQRRQLSVLVVQRARVADARSRRTEAPTRQAAAAGTKTGAGGRRRSDQKR
jgi:hypothetical protein